MKKVKLKLDFDQAFNLCNILFSQVIISPERFQSVQEKILYSLLAEAHATLNKKCGWSYEGRRTFTFTMAQALAMRESIEGHWLATENAWLANVLTINHLRLHKLTA